MSLPLSLFSSSYYTRRSSCLPPAALFACTLRQRPGFTRGLREYTRFNVITPTICAVRHSATRRDTTRRDARGINVAAGEGDATRGDAVVTRPAPLIGMRERDDSLAAGDYISREPRILSKIDH